MDLVLADQYGNAITDEPSLYSYLIDESDPDFTPISLTFTATTLLEGKFTAETVISDFEGTLSLYVYVYEARLQARYYDNTDFTDPEVLKQYDEQINFNWGTGVVGGVQADGVSVRWTGYLYSKLADTYVLSVEADQAVVYVNELQILDTSASLISASLDLSEGTYNTLQVDYVNVSGEAKVVLSWQVGSNSAEVIPGTALFHKVIPKQSSEVDSGPQSVSVSAP